MKSNIFLPHFLIYFPPQLSSVELAVGAWNHLHLFYIQYVFPDNSETPYVLESKYPWRLSIKKKGKTYYIDEIKKIIIIIISCRVYQKVSWVHQIQAFFLNDFNSLGSVLLVILIGHRLKKVLKTWKVPQWIINHNKTAKQMSSTQLGENTTVIQCTVGKLMTAHIGGNSLTPVSHMPVLMITVPD